MFFDADRLIVMREMIFADTSKDRASALSRLLPMQREDFIHLFGIMEGLPVCIRLFDPPLHEFLPHTREGMRELAEALDKPLSEVTRRAEALSEFNPMLGMRGCGWVWCCRKSMKCRRRRFSRRPSPWVSAAFRGAGNHDPAGFGHARGGTGENRIEAVAAAVRTRRGVDFGYKLGVMVETPRAALARRRHRAARDVPVVRHQ
jgi:pyruvate, orthophosphate dikinase